MDNEKKIWDTMLKFIGNPYGTAGQLGNLKAESNLQPTNLQNSYNTKLGMTDTQYTKAIDEGIYTGDDFKNDNAGYGQAQWTYSEHKYLLWYGAKRDKVSIGDLDYQLRFLQEDLNRFSSVLNVLKTASSVKEASDDVLTRYEKPANTSESVKSKRAKYGQEFFDKYADKKWIENNARACKVIASARSRIGDPYVFGARGEPCTPSGRDAYADNDYCPRKKGTRSTCSGCQYEGTHIYDCRGFTYRCLLDANIRIDGAGATSQYNDTSNWAERGLTDDMPDVVCCVFKKVGEKMSHTGLYIGGGVIIHCSGTVKIDTIANRTWTHYAVPVGLYPKTYLASARRLKVVSNLKKGSKGEAVKELQERLFALGYYKGDIDGVYGTGTVTAVKQFQADHALTVDGIAGTQTQAVLDEAFKGKDSNNDDQGISTDDGDFLSAMEDTFLRVQKYIKYINKYAKKMNELASENKNVSAQSNKYNNYINKYVKKIIELTTIKGV